ncbi:hypothetical protein TNCT_321711, partial [Trichonephila clavata]
GRAVIKIPASIQKRKVLGLPALFTGSNKIMFQIFKSKTIQGFPMRWTEKKLARVREEFLTIDGKLCSRPVGGWTKHSTSSRSFRVGGCIFTAILSFAIRLHLDLDFKKRISQCM